MKQRTDQELIEAYKDQQKVERGCSELKDPMFMASTPVFEIAETSYGINDGYS